MATHRAAPVDRLSYYHANRVGMMLVVMTLCQHAVPALMRLLLSAFGVDVTARFWGLDSAAFLWMYLLLYLVMMGIPLAVSGIWLMPKSRRSMPRLSLDRRLCLILCGVALCLIANILAALFSGMLYQAGLYEPQTIPFGDGSILTLLMDLIVFALVPALMEELLLRGIVLQTLRPLGNSTAVTLSAVLFGLMHGNLDQAPFALLMGLVLGSIYVHTDDLRLTVIIHAISNGLSVIVDFLLHYFDTQFATFWELLILIVALMMGGIAALWLYRHPLHRRRTRLAPAAARRAAWMSAPLLWLAIVWMTVLMIVSSIA